jgi:hypothetical protein
MKHDVPSQRASETSSLVTLSALNSIAMFCDFFGSKTLFSSSTGGSTDLLVGSFGTEFAELQPNRVSIMSSFNLQRNEAFTNVKNKEQKLYYGINHKKFYTYYLLK